LKVYPARGCDACEVAVEDVADLLEIRMHDLAREG
jgi:hypothetical protein